MVDYQYLIYSVVESLRKIEIPKSVTCIGSYAFGGCENLEFMFIPSGVEEIGAAIFAGCCKLTTITVDDDNTCFDSRNCCNAIIETNNNSLIASCSSTIIPDGVEILDYESFFENSNLLSISIPSSVMEIKSRAFSECTSLTFISIPNSITSIGGHAFSGCISLKSIIIPEGVKSIGNNVFEDCKNLEIVSLPDSLTRIGTQNFIYEGYSPFYNCKRLKTVYVSIKKKEIIENRLPSIKDKLKVRDMEENQTSPKTINYSGNVWTDEFGVEYNKEKALLLKVPRDLEKYTVIEGTITIGNAAFSNCENLKSVIIANSITEIGHYAFANCNSLYLFAIPQNVRKLGSGAFMGCSELTSILLPNLIVFESDTFEGCEKLASVFVPQGEKYRYEGLFWNHDIDIKEYDPNDEEEMRMLNSIYHGILDECGVLYNYDEEILLSVTKPLEEYSVREGTIGIRVEAFKPDTMGIDRKSLKRLHLPDSLFMICDSAFIYNEGLEYINIPKNAKFLQDSNPFAGCFNLHTIKWETDNAVKEGTLIFNKERTALIACLPWQYTEGNTIIEQDSHVFLPDGLETIAAKTFYHDEKLQEISLPASIKEIGKDVFIGCSSLKSICIPAGTLHKFEKMLPEWVGILKEQYKEVEDSLSDYELPDGSIYNGSCIRKSFGSIELCGLGSISYTNGDKYKGNFKYGRPYGWGIYFFKNGHKHKGYFDDIPNGIGYLNEDYDMAVGNFTNGRLNGWAICYRNRIFKFGYWREGRLITDYTSKTLWIRYEISNHRIEYKGNLIQMDEEHTFIRFGVPEKPLVNTYGNGIKNIWSLRDFFRAHGRMKIANMKNSQTHEIYKCLAFENPTSGVLCFVSFSSGLGELSGAEINSMKNELVVCELNVDSDVAARRAEEGRQIESYTLCKMSALPASQIPLSHVPKMPAYGFEFFKDGTVKVGVLRNHDSGEYMLCKKDGTIDCGKWKENIKTSNNSSFDLDNPENLYDENGIDVFKKC